MVEVDYGHAHSHTQDAKQSQGHAESYDVSLGQFVSLVIDLLVITHHTLQLESDRVSEIDTTWEFFSGSITHGFRHFVQNAKTQ